MSQVTPIDGRFPGPRGPADVLERRTARLLRRLSGLREPIIWLCAGAGTGKSRLLESVRVESVRGGPRTLRFSGWVLLDDPSPAALETALTEFSPETGRDRRLLIASRPDTAMDAVLLRQQIYGRVAILDEHELFAVPQDASDADDALLAATGGCPCWRPLICTGAPMRFANFFRHSSNARCCPSCRSRWPRPHSRP